MLHWETVDPKGRHRKHMMDALSGMERKFCSSLLYYGMMNFDYEVLETCLESDLPARESFWAGFFDAFESGYNVAKIYTGSEPRKQIVKPTKDYTVPRIPDHLKHLPPAKPFSDEDLRKIYAGTYIPKY